MRLMTVGFGLAVLLASTGALAAGPSPGTGAGQKGDTGGKGGTGPASSEASAESNADQPTALDQSQYVQPRKSSGNPDTVEAEKTKEKAWEISGAWETHRLLEQQYVANSSSKVFNSFFVALSYSLTDNDIITLADGVQQVFESDPGEPGVRLSDIGLTYRHVFALPAKFRLMVGAGITAPVGYYSQLASNITTPSLTVSLSRRFGDLSVSAGGRGSYSWDRYTTASGIGCGSGNPNNATCDEGSGSTNNKWAAGIFASVEYDMPFHHPLSVGGSISDGYSQPYNVGAAPYNSTFYGAAGYPNGIGDQPWQQSYGWEVFVRYAIPDLGGFKSDLLLALADGGNGVGDVPVLHDGVVQPYFLYYESAQMYFAYEGRY
jgi:hypothetical protein